MSTETQTSRPNPPIPPERQATCQTRHRKRLRMRAKSRMQLRCKALQSSRLSLPETKLYIKWIRAIENFHQRPSIRHLPRLKSQRKWNEAHSVRSSVQAGRTLQAQRMLISIGKSTMTACSLRSASWLRDLWLPQKRPSAQRLLACPPCLPITGP